MLCNVTLTGKDSSEEQDEPNEPEISSKPSATCSAP